MSWSGGNILSLLAPGLGYSYPWNDAAQDQPGIYPFTDLPEAPEELGEALADWVIETDSEVAAALELEPLDPSGVIEDAERRAWIRRLYQVTVSFEIDVKAEAQKALRESLARRSDLYRRTRDGLASPRSPEGQALAAALDGALDDGNIGRLTSGQSGSSTTERADASPGPWLVTPGRRYDPAARRTERSVSSPVRLARPHPHHPRSAATPSPWCDRC